MWDAYRNSDFILYPTKIEGFGNQFIEAVYFKKPIILTPYPVYERDINSKGFEVIKMGDKVTTVVIKKVKELIDNPEKRLAMVEKNFELGEKYMSYGWVEKKLRRIFKEMNFEPTMGIEPMT